MPMTTEYRLYNSAGCDLGVMTQEEICLWIRRGRLEHGDTIKVTKTEIQDTPVRESQVRDWLWTQKWLAL